MFAGLAATRHSGPYWPRYGVPRPRVVRTRDKDDTRTKRRYRRTWKMRRTGEPVPEMVDVETGQRFGMKTGRTLEEKLREKAALGKLEWELGAPAREREERLGGEERKLERAEEARKALGEFEDERAAAARAGAREDQITQLGTLLRAGDLDPETRAWAEAKLGALGGKLPAEEKPWRPKTREEQLGFARARAEETRAPVAPKMWERPAEEQEAALGYTRREAEARQLPEEPTLTIVEKERERDVAAWEAGRLTLPKAVKLTKGQSAAIKAMPADQLREKIVRAIRDGQHNAAAALEKEYKRKVRTDIPWVPGF